jgi:hypothetical protein
VHSTRRASLACALSNAILQVITVIINVNLPMCAQRVPAWRIEWHGAVNSLVVKECRCAGQAAAGVLGWHDAVHCKLNML